MSKQTIGIFGGGTAGWMTACYLSQNPNFSVTLIESEAQNKIGVGESTIPSILLFLEKCGITENDIFNDLTGVRKYASIHYDWVKNKGPFCHFFAGTEADHKMFSSWIKNYERPPVNGFHAYHIDANLFPSLLKKKSKNVTHVFDTIRTVDIDQKGISKVVCEKNSYSFDTYVDCTGFKSVLRRTLPFQTKGHPIIVNNCAVAGIIKRSTPFVPMTQTHAMDYGWRWTIDLQGRSGVGYVFDKNHISPEQAARELSEKIKIKQEALNIIPFQNEYITEPFVKNMFSVGLANGFLEPLESTSIFMIFYCIQLFERYNDHRHAQKMQNRAWQSMYKHISSFLSVHYQTSDLNHTEYWRSIPRIQSVCRPSSQSQLFLDYSYRQIAHHRGLPYLSLETGVDANCQL